MTDKITAHEKSYLKAVIDRDFYRAECQKLVASLRFMEVSDGMAIEDMPSECRSFVRRAREALAAHRMAVEGRK